VPLEQVMAAAYGCNPSRIVPPLIRPKGDFDYLVTVPDRQEERLQAAVNNKLGYTAHWENRDTDVLRLETIAPDPPAFKLSTATNGNVSYANRKYRFTHMRPAFMMGFLESSFKQPVVDRTGMTNYYDFSVEITWREAKGPDQQQLKDALGNLGLKLEPATESTRMLVVEDTR
ncbi:MAG: TIGR03435 family protein, partial [Verrucomicrobiota bacterium]